MIASRLTQLRACWRGQHRLVVLHLGSNSAAAFVRAWACWRDDPSRCQRLIFVAVTSARQSRSELQAALTAELDGAAATLASQFIAAWPVQTANVHCVDFESGRVRWMLALSEPEHLLPSLRLAADVIWLDPAPWSARLLTTLARKAAAGAALSAPHLQPAQRHSLRSAGFVFQGQTDDALWQPPFAVRAPPSPAWATTHAIVLGAGLAGACAAQALARRGLTVTVLDALAAPAMATSGNAAALFHGTVHALDGHYARLIRSAALHTQRSVDLALAAGDLPGSAQGCLRLVDAPPTLHTMHTWLRAQHLPEDFVQAVDAAAASALAGTALSQAAWFYPGGGWVSPVHWVQRALSEPRIRFMSNVQATALTHDGGDWVVQGRDHRALARAPVLVLANGAGAAPLLASAGHAGWPTRLMRGQVTQWLDTVRKPLRMPVGGDGYVVNLPDGHWLCGATREISDGQDGDAPRASDHDTNVQRTRRLVGFGPPEGAVLSGRVGWRVDSADSLPLAGAVPLRDMPASQRRDQARLLPREPGLFVLTALGSRGMTWAPLLGDFIAAQVTGDPWPLEQDLADAVDPARFAVRRARRSD